VLWSRALIEGAEVGRHMLTMRAYSASDLGSRRCKDSLPMTKVFRPALCPFESAMNQCTPPAGPTPPVVIHGRWNRA